MNLADIQLTGRWWRFDKYEIRDGYIRPAAGAALEEYSVFEDYLRPLRSAQRHTKSRAEEPGLHEDLANLGTGRSVVSNENITAEQEQGILEWVHNWGLLGYLPHTLEHVTFDSGALLIKQPHSWRGTHSHDVDINVDFPLRRGPGWVITSNLDRRSRFVESVAETMPIFFPDLQSNEEYPVPLTSEFWHLYAEPVGLFLTVANQVRDVMLGMPKRSLLTDEFLRSDKHDEVGDALSDWWYTHNWISGNAIFAPTMPGFFPGEEPEYPTTLEVPTLLAVAASLMWSDLASGRVVRSCARPACGRIFVTGISARLYCSGNCKKAEEMRRWRPRRAERLARGTSDDAPSNH